MRHILVTRPQGQAGDLLQLLEEAGYRTSHCPAIVIEPQEPDADTRQRLMDLDQYKLVFVASPNAARRSLERLADYWPQWPAEQRWVAVGEATARVLRDAGLSPEVAAGERNSEAVLALPSVQALAPDDRMLILRGEGGRELLTRTLEERGVIVEHAELYRRRCNPDFQWPASPVDAVLVTSVESWQCLRDNTEQLPGDTLVVAGSKRIADRVLTGGQTRVAVADSPRDRDMVACLCQALPARQDETMTENPGDDTHATEGTSRDDTGARAAAAPPSRAAGPISIVLLLVLLAGGGWLAWFWLELYTEDREALEQRITELREDLDTRDEEQRALREEQDERVASLEYELALQEEHLVNLRERDREDWWLAEAEALAALAGQRLALTSDVAAARRLLDASDQVLSRLDDADISRVRETLAQDRERLRQAGEVDIHGTILELGALSERISALGRVPGAPVTPEPETTPDEDAEELAGWERLLKRLPLTIRYHEEHAPLPLEEQQVRQLQLLLTALLQEARLALLQRHVDGYRAALAQTREVTLQWFSASDPAVEGFLARLDELEQRQLEYAVPEIGAGLAAIRELRRERDRDEESDE